MQHLTILEVKVCKGSDGASTKVAAELGSFWSFRRGGSVFSSFQVLEAACIPWLRPFQPFHRQQRSFFPFLSLSRSPRSLFPSPSLNAPHLPPHHTFSGSASPSWQLLGFRSAHTRNPAQSLHVRYLFNVQSPFCHIK